MKYVYATFSNYVIFFQRYYLHKAQSQVINYNRLPANLNWLTTDHGFRFFVDSNWNFIPFTNTSSFTILSDPIDPLSHVTRVCIRNSFFFLLLLIL